MLHRTRNRQAQALACAAGQEPLPLGWGLHRDGAHNLPLPPHNCAAWPHASLTGTARPLSSSSHDASADASLRASSSRAATLAGAAAPGAAAACADDTAAPARWLSRTAASAAALNARRAASNSFLAASASCWPEATTLALGAAGHMNEKAAAYPLAAAEPGSLQAASMASTRDDTSRNRGVSLRGAWEWNPVPLTPTSSAHSASMARRQASSSGPAWASSSSLRTERKKWRRRVLEEGGAWRGSATSALQPSGMTGPSGAGRGHSMRNAAP
mmetsp:Transcript_20064/g.76924  ORF Transcript_20064/g.76924 Transcript_20064/m.76924 type:complete len:272 (-) Transcript_20064:420-1235(-)